MAAPGRELLRRLVATAVVGGLLLLPGPASSLATLRDLPSTIAEVEPTYTTSGALILLALVQLAVVGALLAGRRWLRTAAVQTGAASVRSLLDAVPPRPESEPGGIASMRRSVLAATSLGALGSALVLLGEGLRLAAFDGTAARAGAVIAIGGVAAITLAAALVPSVLRAVERREVEAVVVREASPDLLPEGRSPWLLVAAAVVLVAAATVPFISREHPAPDCRLDESWRCAAVLVPDDHFDPAPRQAVRDVAYAVHPATRPADGRPGRVLIFVTGGPGGSGLSDGAWTIDRFDPRIVEQFDVVSFDARGVGLSGRVDCPRAETALDEQPPSQLAARTFAEDCIAEAGVGPGELGRYSTAQVVEDIEAIRAELGQDRITLYGVSYGTVVAQAYAAAHPDHLDGLVLDAPVDRALPAARMWVASARGFDAAVEATLQACLGDRDCEEALPDPHGTLARLRGRLAAGPLDADVAEPYGKARSVTLTGAEFEAITFFSMYSPTERMAWLRALATYERGDPRGILHLREAWSGDGTGSDGSSSFAYWATWCSDVRASPTVRTDDYPAFGQVALDAGLDDPNLLQIAGTLAPCLFWPAQPAAWQAPREATGVPTLILTSTDDPVTPPSGAHAILDRLPDAHLVETHGGGHGSLGIACVNDEMAAFVVDGRVPTSRTTLCAEDAIAPFIPLATTTAATARDAVFGLIDELTADPLVLHWNRTDGIAIGCADGGVARLVPAGDGGRVNVTLEDCAWAADAVFGGSGWLDLATWEADLTLDSPRGKVQLTIGADGGHLTGAWDGRPLDEDY